MREINVSTLTDVIERLCIDANDHLPGDVKCAIRDCRACEDGEIAQGVLDNIIENYEIADSENVPICQDTGMACVFLEIGQDVHLVGGDLARGCGRGCPPRIYKRISAQICCKGSGAPRKYRRQYTGYALHGDRAGREY